MEEGGQVLRTTTAGASSWNRAAAGSFSPDPAAQGLLSAGRRQVGDLWQWILVAVLVAMTMSVVNLPGVQQVGLIIRYPLAALLLLLTLRRVPGDQGGSEPLGARRSWFVAGLAGCAGAALFSTVGHPEVSAVAVLPLVLLLAVPAALVHGRWRDGVPAGDLQVVAVTSGLLVAVSLVTGLAGLPFAVGVGDSTAEMLESGEGRISGLYGNPNSLGLVAMATTALCSAAALATRRRMVYAIFAVCALAALVLSQSRTAQLAFGLSALLVLLVVGWKRGLGNLSAWVLAPFVLGGALVFGGLELLPDRVQAALGRFGAEEGGSRFNGRETMWEAAIHLWSQRPFNGHGYAYSREALEHLAAQGGWDLPVRSPHQSYLQWGLETGWLGFVPLGVVFLAVMAGIVAGAGSSAWMTGLHSVVLAGLLAMTMESVMFGTGFTYSWVFWIACAAVVVGRVRPTSPDVGQAGRR